MADRAEVRSYGRVFDDFAAEYDRRRPDYPEVLIDRACKVADLAPGARVLEIGCGTGQLTRSLLARGLRVTAVEPGEQLIERALNRLDGAGEVQYVTARLEEAPTYRDLDGTVAGVAQRRDNVSEAWAWLGSYDIARGYACDLFDDAQLAAVPSLVEHAADELNGLLSTMSFWARLSPGQRAALVAGNHALHEALGRPIRSSAVACLLTAAVRRFARAPEHAGHAPDRLPDSGWEG